jgi:hypothetical protein
VRIHKTLIVDSEWNSSQTNAVGRECGIAATRRATRFTFFSERFGSPLRKPSDKFGADIGQTQLRQRQWRQR